ncbi:MAG TPA: hypothetical protein VEO91_05730 [Candidatus Limnocylindria bacterium]|nr:hypothetical protein [Candidatus Limnocylindria bacterium]
MTADQDVRSIRMCIDKRVPRDRASAAEATALATRPDNLMVAPIRAGGPVRSRLAVEVASEWKPGTSLHVRFLDGPPEVRHRVEAVAHGWEQFANVRLVFDDRPDAQIRVTFQLDGSWSYVGQVALHIPDPEPTMNFGWLTPDTEQEEYSRVVLHEFGHALGCVHEHQSPSVRIPWDPPAVYAYYALQGWDKAEVDQQVLIPYSPQGIQFSRFDEKSIMLYPVDERLTVGTFSIGWNRELSDLDKSFIASRYPFQEKQIIPLTLRGSPAQGEISTPGEIDWFRFTVRKTRRYVLQTIGTTDTVMSLHGPNTQAALVAADDDSGPGLNARIERNLQPARYFVQIRHFGTTGIGPYQVSLEAV